MNTRVILSVFLVILLLVTLACSNSGSSLPSDYGSNLPSNAVVIYGDSRTGHAIHQRIVDDIIRTEPVAVFHTGDLVGDGANRADWDKFNEITAKLRETTKFYPALGNHDLPPQIFLENFDLPNNERWYSVEIDDIHFIVLDSNSSTSEGSEQYRWLETDLQNARDKARFVVAIFHHPPFSTGPHVEDEKGLRQTLVPLFEEYGVDIVFSGHDHDYERSLVNGIYYVVTGGGGAPLYDQARTSSWSQKFVKAYHFCTLSVNNNQLTTSVFDINLKVIDQFTVSAKSMPSKQPETITKVNAGDSEVACCQC